MGGRTETEMRTLQFSDYERYAEEVRALVDASARKAALLILSGEIRRTLWCDQCIAPADQLASALMVEAVRIDADAMDALRVIIERSEVRP